MNDVISKAGMLYIVATPIGNLGDISERAKKTLAEVDMVLAEDTRHSKYLMQHFAINTAMQSCHEHNEAQRIDSVIAALQQGKNIALISDAGTPLINDPGYQLVRAVQDAGFVVSPIPGASSIITALCASGLPTDSFIFDGFLPAKQQARQKKLHSVLDETRTLIFLESSHRIVASLRDIQLVMQQQFEGQQREMVLARELTKQFETIKRSSVGDILAFVEADSNQQKGEFVLIIAGQPAQATDASEVNRVLQILLQQLPVKQAAEIASKLTGEKKNDLYKLALELQK